MRNVRIWFEKKGSAKYISHLDLTRCMSRALRASALPVWYTEGFNPRVYMTFGMPLSLGITGKRECMDIRLTEDMPLEKIQERLNLHLPLDLRVLEAAEPLAKLEAIRWADYSYRMETTDSTLLEKAFEKLFSLEAVTVLKHTKKGEKEFDIKPYFQKMIFDARESSFLTAQVLLPCSVEGSINPALLLDALQKYSGEEPYTEICRNRLLTKVFLELR